MLYAISTNLFDLVNPGPLLAPNINNISNLVKLIHFFFLSLIKYLKQFNKVLIGTLGKKGPISAYCNTRQLPNTAGFQ